ncbi:MAG: hypothetical protein ACREEM_05900 [Blastocatellia bacterium]
MPCTSFSVDLLVVTPNQLRKMDIGLAKDCQSDGTVKWTMVFELQERKKTIESFAHIVKLKVVIDPTLFKQAEVTAKKGFDQDQISQVVTAADTAKRHKQGKVSAKRAQADVQDIVAARAS